MAATCWCIPLFAEIAAKRLQEIRETRLDPRQCYRVRDLFLEREDVKFFFTDGYLLFAQPHRAQELAALFVAGSPTDEGEILLIPPSPQERQSLTRFISDPVLNHKFRTAMMLFSDDTAEVLRARLAKGKSNKLDLEAGRRLAESWNPVLRNILEGPAVRMLMDTLSGRNPRAGFFVAAVTGGPKGRFDVVVDRRIGSVSVGQTVWREGRGYYETWCQFPSRSFRQGRRGPDPDNSRLENYYIEARLFPDLQMKFRTKATFVAENLDDRVIGFELSERLLLTKLLLNGEGVEFLQFDEPASSEVRQRQNNLVAIVLDEKPAQGTRYELEFHYEGKVISDAGDGVYYVGSRGNWYPRRKLHFTHFEIVFHHPESLDLVATGERMETATENGIRTTRFRTSSPVRVAGFNLGHYEKVSKQAGNYVVEVCANKSAEKRLQPPRPPSVVWIDPARNPLRRSKVKTPIVIAPVPSPVPLQPAQRIEEIAARSAEAVSFFADRFGPLPVSRIVISPIPGDFGQGFPGLVYVSTLTYFRPGDPPLKGYSPSVQLFYTELLGTHEIAHQWWGNVVTTHSAADRWMMEALATYSALLFLEHRTGREVMDEVLQEYKQRLLERNEAGTTTESAGAIVLGERLRSSLSPSAARVIVYEKGAWIIHMLRGIMGDEKFFTFLKHLQENYAFGDLTAEDFRREAARFVPGNWPDPKLENFFEEWIYGTGIPALKVTYRVKGRSGRFRLSGRLRQGDVPPSFSVVVPIEIHTASGKSLVKWIPTEGEVTDFMVVLRNKPSRVVIDPGNAVLLTRQR